MKSVAVVRSLTLFLIVLIEKSYGEVISNNSSSSSSPSHGHPDVASKENTFKEFYLKEKERSKSSHSNPSVDEIISGIIQLIGNVNLSKPPSKPPPTASYHQHDHQDEALGRINNRGPAFPKHAVSANSNLFHPSVLIGPGPPAGLPLPLNPFHKINKPPAHSVLPPKSSFNFQEKNLTALMGQKLLQLPKDSYNNFRRVPGNTILPKPLPPPQRDRDGIGSQLRPEFLAPPAFVHDSNYPKMPADLSLMSPKRDKRPNSVTLYNKKADADDSKESVAQGDAISSISSSHATDSSGHATIKATTAVTSSSSSESAVIRPTPTTRDPVFESTEENRESESEASSEMSGSSEWLPVGASKASKSWSEDPPIIITQEEASVFDITIRHKLGAGVAASDGHKNHQVKVTLPPVMRSTSAEASIATTTHHDTNTHSSSPSSSSPSSSSITTKDSFLDSPSPTSTTSSTSSATASIIPAIQPSRTRSTDMSTSDAPAAPLDEDIVYGKPVETNRPVAPSMPEVTVVGSGILSTSHLPPVTRTQAVTGYQRTPIASLSPYGRPIVVPVDVDEVRPKMGSGATAPAVVTDPGQGSVYIDGRPTHFKIRHAASPPTLQVGSQVSVKPGPNDHPRAGSLLPSHRPPLTLSGKQPAVRRPPFRPRPVVPLVRIDTCIVGDETTCEVKLNERCKTEIGISSCQCKPGFGRSTSRGMCNPIVTLAVSLRLDKMGENKLTFNRNYMNPNSEEYQFLEYETIQGFNSMLGLSRLAKVFMGVRVNKFYSAAGKLLVNASIDLEQNNATRSSAIKRVVQQELGRVIALSNSNIGDSQLWVDSSANSVPRIEDINECSSHELNDCSTHAACTNEFGTFRCACKKGYEDKFAGDAKKAGRYCSSCSPQYCSNRGECHIVDGERECRCRGNFIGSKCDIDVEVLGVAVGGSVAALVIIVITFLCLYMWNQKWKAEQQKIEAMSAASAQTFSYMTKQQQQQSAAGYRYAIDDRYRWAQVNESNFYSQPEHILAPSQQHVYATPSRVHTPNALIAEEVFEPRHNHYSRPSRSKSRNSTLHGHHYQASTIGGPGSLFNETEFSTRETIYAPSHLIMTSPRSKYAVYS